MVLPFEVKTSQLSGVGMILQFDSVGTCNGVNTSCVCVSVLWAPDKDDDVDVNANTPYLVQMNDETLGIDGGVIIKKTTEAVVYDKSYAAEQNHRRTVGSYEVRLISKSGLAVTANWDESGAMPEKNAMVPRLVNLSSSALVHGSFLSVRICMNRRRHCSLVKPNRWLRMTLHT